jgi:hypothetical protein
MGAAEKQTSTPRKGIRDGNLSELDFIRKTGLQPQHFKRKLVLDAYGQVSPDNPNAIYYRYGGLAA